MRLVEIISAALVMGASLASLAHQGDPPPSPALEAFAGLPLSANFAALVDEPVAVRGSVLLLPIVRRSADVAWPSSFELRLADGRTIVARVAKIEWRDAVQANWTSRSRVSATAEVVGDDAIVLLAKLPIDGHDEIFFAQQRLNPIWMDGLPALVLPRESLLELNTADLPDSATASEYFRSVLLAHRIGAAPPAPTGGELDILYARAIAGLWSAAIARLEENDPVTSARVLGDITGRAHGIVGDSQQTMAAWKTDYEELDALLRSLLAPRTQGIILVESAKMWLESRSTLLCWLECDEGESVLIGVANPRAEVCAVAFRWPDQKEASVVDEIGPESFGFFSVPRVRPSEADTVVIEDSLVAAIQEHGLSALLPPAQNTRNNAGRQAIESRARSAPVLLLEEGNNATGIAVGHGRTPLRPPGIGFGTFLPAANLEEIRAGSLKSPPAEWATTAVLRRRPFGWELLVECMVPPGASVTSDQVKIVIVGSASHTVVIHADGRVESDEPTHANGLALHQAKDRWRARLPLPEAWVSLPDGRYGRMEISMERSIDGVGTNTPPAYARRQFAGIAPLTIQPFAKRIPLDLSSWNLSSVTLAP